MRAFALFAKHYSNRLFAILDLRAMLRTAMKLARFKLWHNILIWHINLLRLQSKRKCLELYLRGFAAVVLVAFRYV